jgi:hypothetical protein
MMKRRDFGGPIRYSGPGGSFEESSQEGTAVSRLESLVAGMAFRVIGDAFNAPRPPGLPLVPTRAVTTIATTLAVSAGRGVASGWVALAVLTGQFWVGLGNDHLDRDRDHRAGRINKPMVAGRIGARTVGIAGRMANPTGRPSGV